MSTESEREAFHSLLLAPSLRPFAAALEAGLFDPLLPGLRVELDIPQNTHWHVLGNLRHSVATAEALPAIYEARLTGLLHDLGKRQTRLTNGRGEDSYPNHGPVGAALALPYLVRLGIDGPMSARICRLVEHHMDPHFAARDAVSETHLDRVIRKHGSDLPALLALAQADGCSMAPEIATRKGLEINDLVARLQARLGSTMQLNASPWIV